ncbi:Aste57867_23705 [Aphanomyces stellatus]|uniref:Aste57867_23705 protein n=1 Tax=Aphanomyces stellatus TaxID=120398 RepID=A0A485LNQ9_9STRA|nr:hypothetical protein As57867_023633 [Aphanomyces stellatus]VFU00350.1 Aste57867_23705 [Aphanomyces stellatus]
MKPESGSITIEKRGPKPYLPSHVEQDLVSWIAAMQRVGWPVERYEVILKASQIISNHAGISSTVGRGWYARFEKRNSALAPRVAQSLSKARNAVTKEGVTKYFFDLVKGSLGFKCTAANVYNVDETSFKNKGKTKKVVAIRGSRNVWRGTTMHTTSHCSRGGGRWHSRSPAFTLPGASCAATVLDDCPVQDAMISTSPKAFMNSDLFDSWLEHFGEWKLRVRKARPAILVLDNCSSHLSVNSLSICEAYGIYLVRLPPNALPYQNPQQDHSQSGFHVVANQLKDSRTRACQGYHCSPCHSISIR